MTVEYTFAFGEHRTLVGTLTMPSTQRPRRFAVLMFNSGVIHRVGPHRINVKAARRFADAGIASMRFDVSGLGDSGSSQGMSSFDRQAVEDLVAAMDEVTARTGIDRFAVHGICSGAVHALAATLEDERIVGLAMQDGFVFTTPRARMRRYLLPLRHEFSRAVRGAMRRLGALARRGPRTRPVVATSAGDGPLGTAGYTPERFAEALDRLSERGTSTLVLYTGSILNLYNYAGQFAERIRLRSTVSRVECVFAPDLDHTLSNRHAQGRMLDLLERWLVGLETGAPQARPSVPPTAVPRPQGTLTRRQAQ